MGAWIEIIYEAIIDARTTLSHPTMGAWIEIYNQKSEISEDESHPTMGAWIEIRLWTV